MQSKKRIVRNRHSYLFKKRLSNEDKLRIEKHPQSDEYFIFIKIPGNIWNWYVRSRSS